MIFFYGRWLLIPLLGPTILYGFATSSNIDSGFETTRLSLVPNLSITGEDTDYKLHFKLLNLSLNVILKMLKVGINPLKEYSLFTLFWIL